MVFSFCIMPIFLYSTDTWYTATHIPGRHWYMTVCHEAYFEKYTVCHEAYFEKYRPINRNVTNESKTGNDNRSHAIKSTLKRKWFWCILTVIQSHTLMSHRINGRTNLAMQRIIDKSIMVAYDTIRYLSYNIWIDTRCVTRNTIIIVSWRN